MIPKLPKTNKGLPIQGPLLLINKVFSDERGFFYESWNKRKFDELINNDCNFVQDNHSKSSKGVLRGLHYQMPPFAQGKLIRCTKGKIFDVAVDIRLSSPTFSCWVSAELDDMNKNQFWIPEGFAHGFFVLSQFAEVQYKTTNYWNKESEVSLKYNDKEININWPFEFINFEKPAVSQKDLCGLNLKSAESKGLLFQ